MEGVRVFEREHRGPGLYDGPLHHREPRDRAGGRPEVRDLKVDSAYGVAHWGPYSETDKALLGN